MAIVVGCSRKNVSQHALCNLALLIEQCLLIQLLKRPLGLSYQGDKGGNGGGNRTTAK